MSKRIKSNSIRIIAGQWRGRRLPVLDRQGLRPTTDRVRETLFNWLMHEIAGARCLDLFAGSGALGFECLSRGAALVQLVEADTEVAANLQQVLELLLGSDQSTQSAAVTQLDALRFINRPATEQFDMVFLDPPFDSDLLVQSAVILEDNGWLAENAMIYTETDSKTASVELPSNWKLIKQGRAGQSAYYLFQRH